MKIIEPSVEFITPLNGYAVMRRIEECGRVCYKSEHKITKDSYKTFCKGIVKRGHESVLEHAAITVKFICDRAVSHEIVRHRIASFSQMSQRYCNYNKDQFGCEVTFIRPCFFEPNTHAYRMWVSACVFAETAYFDLLGEGCSPEQARTVLPNSTMTEVVMTANIREWRHFLKLRTSEAAHPQIRQLANQVLIVFAHEMPELFEDIMPNGEENDNGNDR